MASRRLQLLAWTALAIVGLLAAPASAATLPDATGYVVDEAGVVPDDQQARIEADLTAYDQRSGRQISIAFVSSIDRSIEEYAVELAEAWGVGDAERDDGVLYVVALDTPEGRKHWLTVGRGAEGDLNDAKVGRILRNELVPMLQAGDFAEAAEAAERAIRREQGDPQWQDPLPDAAAVGAGSPYRGGGGFDDGGGGISPLFMILLIFFVFFLLSRGGRRRRRRRRRWGDDDDYRGGGIIPFPIFIGGGGWGGGDGGGWGGGGGGGGGFGGFGGGSFGGGGAGGSW